MAALQPMPPLELPATDLRAIARHWDAPECALPKSWGERLGHLCDSTVGKRLAAVLGNRVTKPASARDLLPPEPDCVEVGPTRVIGGIRPQNFDVVYRPDGVRFAFDSKTLNTRKSLSKNYQNMINDLGTEAATVHTRFPSAIVAFVVAVPEPCMGTHKHNLTSALNRLAGRNSTSGDVHKAEAIALLVWDPVSATVLTDWPPADSILRVDAFSRQIQKSYEDRFAGLPPHNL